MCFVYFLNRYKKDGNPYQNAHHIRHSWTLKADEVPNYTFINANCCKGHFDFEHFNRFCVIFTAPDTWEEDVDAVDEVKDEVEDDGDEDDEDDDDDEEDEDYTPKKKSKKVVAAAAAPSSSSKKKSNK